MTLDMTLVWKLLVLVWVVSAAICLEAYAEAQLDQKWKWPAILIGSLTPVFNTLIAAFFLRDFLKKGD